MKKILLMAPLFIVAITINAQIKTHRKSQTEILNDQYCSGLFKNAEGTIIDVANENVQSYLNILDWLEGRVAGLQVFVSRNGTRVPVIRGSAAGVYVDEIRVDASFLNSLSVNDIAMIKVIKGPFAGAIGNGGGGTIAIYTYKGEDEDDESSSPN